MASKTDEELIAAIPTGYSFIDFPTAWALQRSGLDHRTSRCSAEQADFMLCDCGAVEAKWESLRTVQQAR